jgi:hypothetical protein
MAMEAKSSNIFWKEVRRLADPRPTPISITASSLKDIFEKHLNPPKAGLKPVRSVSQGQLFDQSLQVSYLLITIDSEMTTGSSLTKISASSVNWSHPCSFPPSENHENRDINTPSPS